MILNAFLSVFLLFLFMWVIHLFLKNAGVVDVGWGLGFIILSYLYLIHGQETNIRNVLFFLMVAAWGLRISLFLIKRLAAENREDKRYQKMRQDWNRHIPVKFFFFFEFQAVLQMILAIPFLIVGLNPASNLGLFEILGAIIFGIGLIGETISDEQLQGFKTNSLNKGKTCDIGFWQYSRHPNYFFEWLIWTGFFVFALGSPWGWVAVISPALMYYLIVYVSGVPLAEEQALLSRGEAYRAYQRTTSMFFPLPRRKS